MNYFHGVVDFILFKSGSEGCSTGGGWEGGGRFGLFHGAVSIFVLFWSFNWYTKVAILFTYLISESSIVGCFLYDYVCVLA